MKGLACFLVAFLVASILMTAGSVLSARGWRPAEPVAPLDPAAEKMEPPAQRLPILQIKATIPGTASDAAAAWIVQPARMSTNRPGVVLVHGAGPGTRDSLLAEARVLATAGVAVIVYDKRGGWTALAQRDFGALATDALRAAAVLRATPGIDPSRVGLMGLSEGGWVVTEAARRQPEQVAFVGLVSAPVVAPAAQLAWIADHGMPWLSPWPDRWLDRAVATTLASGSSLQPWVTYDSTAGLTAMRLPVAGWWGAEDATVPVNAAIRSVRGTVPGPTSLHVVPGAGHQIPIATGYLEGVARWIRDAGSGISGLFGVEPASNLGVATLPAITPLGQPAVQLLVCSALATCVVLGRRFRLRTHLTTQGATQ